MINIAKLNGGIDSPFEKVDGEKFKFIDRKAFTNYDKDFLLLGVYQCKGKLGIQTVYICSEINDSSKGFRFSINDVTKYNEIMADNEIIKAIKEKKITVAFEKYHSDKWKRDCVGTIFKEIEVF
jgi:exo-beta-1,3-glucanase (GH17 family)